MGWRGIVDHDRQTVFFWSQKAACTTFFSLLGQNRTPRPESKQVFLHLSLPWQDCSHYLHERGYRSVIVARHPLSRLISAYLNKFVVHYGRPLRHHLGLEPFARDMHLGICATAQRDPEVNRTSFDEFLAAVARDHAARPDPWTPINGHWDTQVPPPLAARGFRYDRVVSVERLDSELADMARDLNLQWDGAALNRTDYADAAQTEPGYLGHLGADQLHGRPYTAANFMSDAAVATAWHLHAGDYDVFGYDALPGPPGAAYPNRSWASSSAETSASTSASVL
jgi:hypothetical protein